MKKRWLFPVLLLAATLLACSSTSRLTPAASPTVEHTPRARTTPKPAIPQNVKKATPTPRAAPISSPQGTATEPAILTATPTNTVGASITQGAATSTPGATSTPKTATWTAAVTLTVTAKPTNTPKVTSTQTNTKTITRTPAPTRTPTITLTPTETKTPSTLFGQTLLDVIYCTMGDRQQKLDMYFPTDGNPNGPWPVVVHIHGGGWTQGDKTEGKWLANWLNPYGYAVVLVNYRLYPDFYFPAFIEDPKCAIRYLRAHARDYNLNPRRMAAWGSSAGGHLVALLGTTNKNVGWDVGEYDGVSSRVQAVVDLAGPTDLTVRGLPKLEPLIRLAFNAVPKDRGPYSPITYVSADDPPFFIAHGNQDDVVQLDQSKAMYNALLKAGVPAQLVIAKNGTHSFTAAGNKPMTPSMPEILEMARAFLDSILKSP